MNVSGSALTLQRRRVLDGYESVVTTKSTSSQLFLTTARLKQNMTATPVPSLRGRGSGTDDLSRLVKTTWNGIKEILGFVTTVCHNGGTRTIDNECRCPKLFQGASCEKRVCLNGGKLEKAKYGPVSWDCKCPAPQYIEGAHCEKVRCANNAHLRTEANDSWWCDCSESFFHSGRFCEEFTAPYAVFAVPLACLLLFALCIAVCQMDLCPRRRRSRHLRGSSDSDQRHTSSHCRRRIVARTQTRRANQAAGNQTAITQELLIPDDHGLCRRGVAYPHGIVAPYVIRLDTIPHFNPHMIGGVDPLSPAKPLEPPPSYEQAVASLPAVQPPSYTETTDEQMTATSKKVEWQKVLYLKQPFPDNYSGGDEQFLCELKKNLSAVKYSYWEAVFGVARLVFHLNLIALLYIIFEYVFDNLLSVNILVIGLLASSFLLYMIYAFVINDDNIDFLDHFYTIIVLILFGYATTPAIRTLTDTISTDTVFALSFITALISCVFHDYGINAPIVSYQLSVSSGLSSAVFLLSRLNSNDIRLCHVVNSLRIACILTISQESSICSLCTNLLAVDVFFDALLNISPVDSTCRVVCDMGISTIVFTVYLPSYSSH
ncbi:phosphatidylinositol N-acetylglucosaminyltransferase [Dictyocaulus viviparus]|uniref:Phosphatidylinositol N-acetylglucosaminyltransferase n=1 Tax=Dictyocaulus viviparus TaxID=29172 RepID=A0A0D8XDQ1_DICVI|nr:phosphatidylinositol N-acetylglucosaminyltransferase [Dictyocaulus viviparus]